MKYQRVTVTADMLSEIPEAFIPTLAYTIGQDGEPPQIFQWHVFDAPGLVPLSDNPDDETFWETVAQRHLEVMLAPLPLVEAKP